jgi:S1-C subfamily serine protease
MFIKLDPPPWSAAPYGVANRFLLVGMAAFCFAAGALAAAPEKSVVQISTFSQQPLWDTPWRFDQVRKSSGTGFVIKGKRIMTNAHVVDWPREILVHRYQDPRPYIAHVRYIGPDCDLAILEVDDDRFFNGMEALEFGPLPPVRTTVVTYGYPAGGEQISYTRGVVSRIEVQSFVHGGNRAYLAAQTDAAINPGNSGGPVIQDDKVVGVAFQGQPGLENTGFFIPTTIADHFLHDIEDGRYDGFPQAGIRFVSLQNDAYRNFLGLPDNDLGARVDYIYDVPTTRDLVKLDDVVLKVGKYEVGSDGTILYEGNRVSLAVAITEVQSGDKIPLKIWRDKKEMEISLPVYTYKKDEAEGNQHVTLPRFYVYGGLVFTPLSRDYMRTTGGGWADALNSELTYELFYRRHESPETMRTEPIVLSTVLPHKVNANFDVRGRTLINTINGVKIDRLEDVIKAFESAPPNGQHVIEFFPEKNFECLDREDVRQANAEILKAYGIAKDRRL